MSQRGGRGGGAGAAGGRVPAGGDDDPPAPEIQDADPPGQENDIVPEDVGFSEMQIATLKRMMDDSNDRFYQRLNENTVTFQNTLKGEIDDTLNSYKEEAFQKRLSYDVDFTAIKKRICQLPVTGNLDELFKEKAINESINMTTINQGDDSLDMSFYNRASVTALLAKPDYVSKSKRNATGDLKYSLAEFVGPQDNENWINARETTLTEVENAILDKFNIIQDREQYVRPLRPSAGNRGVTALKEEAEFKKDLYNKSQKWNQDFKRDVANWKLEDDFDDWFESLWRAADQNLVDDPKLLKEVLFDRIYQAKGKHLGSLIKPNMNKTVSALKYYLIVRRLVVPFVDAEMASNLFYQLKQGSTEYFDTFFHRKLKMFQTMYPSNITKRQWKDFYTNVAKSVCYTNLAKDLSTYLDTMIYLEDYNAFLNYATKRCQHYITWENSGHTDPENIRACYTETMDLLYKENKAETKKHLVVNEVNSDVTFAGTENDITTDIMPSWVSNDEEDITYEDITNVIGALNGQAKIKKCWHCNKNGHIVTDCWEKRDGKPPTPDSRFGKMKTNFKGSKIVPNNRALPDQFAKKSINQVDGQTAGCSQDQRDSEKAKDMQQMEALINEVMRSNLKSNPP